MEIRSPLRVSSRITEFFPIEVPVNRFFASCPARKSQCYRFKDLGILTNRIDPILNHSTVTLFARFLGLSTSLPSATAVWYASSWRTTRLVRT